MFSYYFLEWSNCVSVICVYVFMRMHDHRMLDAAFEYFNVYVVWSFPDIQISTDQRSHSNYINEKIEKKRSLQFTITAFV